MVAPHWAAKGIPCAFNLQKAGAREQNASKTRETCEKHASISGGRLHSSGTLLPFFYEGITRAVVTKR